jgi:GntR family transcriptional regulator/MocR family aminotransferase
VDYAAVRAAVLTPAHQYPMGVTLHPRRRRAATAWAHDGGLVVEDDYDGEFRYDRQPVGALQGTAPDHVVYVGTAAKTLGPALRLAWMVLPAPLLGPVAEAKRHTDLHTETIGQLTLAELITSHAYDRHIRACRVRYRRRRDKLVARLRPLAGRGVTVRGIAAGLSALVSLPAGGPSEAEVLARAAGRGLAVGGLGGHWHAPGAHPPHPPGLIVGYGAAGEDRYDAALDALVETLAGKIT